MAASISLGLVGANPTATVLANLTTASASVKASINATLNASLKSDLAKVIDQGGYPTIAGLLKEMSDADIAASQNTTLQAFLSAQLDPLVAKDPTTKQAVDAELANISTTTTVGTLLNLNQPLQSHPLFAIGVNQAQLGELLSTNPSLASTQLQTDFINAYAASAGSMSDFWSQLSKNKEFTNLIPQLQLTLQLGAFSLNNTPLVAALQKGLKLSTLRDLTTQVTAASLTNLITVNKIQIPAGIPGQTPDSYAAAMMSLLNAAFPTDFVAQGLKASTDTLNKGVATFLANSPDFDLATTNVNSYTKQNSATAFKGIAADQVSAVTNRISAVQRVFRVNSDPNVIQTLIASGLDSARKIASMPQGVFMRQFTQVLGSQSTALLVYNGARQISGVTSNLYRTIQEALQQANPAAIGNSTGGFSDALNQIIPNWQTLFGPTSYCECDECNAMDGPAAYFVDLLQFLQGANTGGGANPQNPSGFTPLDVLIGYQNNPNNSGNAIPASVPVGRRPDLAYLKLTCANSDTALPYVDLVNEILESYVYYVGMGISVGGVSSASGGQTLSLSSPALPNFPDGGNIISVNNQSLPSPIAYALGSDQKTLNLVSALPTVPTSPFTIGISAIALASNNTPSDATADDLRVNPEYTIAAVYSGPLVTAIYPLNLPYDRFRDTARIYLNFLGSSRYQLMRSFGVFSATQDQPAMMAAESLSLSQTEYELITGSSFLLNTPAPPQYIYSAANAYTFYGYSGASVQQPNSSGTVQTLPWNQWLVQVPEFLKRTGLAYTDLVSLLETEYLNPGQTIFIQFQDNTCNIDTALIVGATVTTVNITGSPTPGDTINLVVTSGALPGSPLKFSYTIAAPTAGAPPGAALNAAAVSLAGQINGNATLNTANVSAVVSGAIITISVSSSLTPSPGWSSNVTTTKAGAASEIVTVTSTSSVPDFFADLPPFLRLWRKLGWQMSELDKAITAMNTGGINRSFVLAVAQLKQLQAGLNVSVSQLLSLWANIEADGRDSLYINLFQNKTVLNPLDEAFELTYRASLALPSTFAALPATWPDGTTNQAVYDSTDDLLEFPGTMSDGEQDNLLTWAGSDDSAILAIQNLFNQRWMSGTDIVVPPTQSPLICDHMNTILAALQVSAADLSAISVDCELIPAGADLSAAAYVALGGSVTVGNTVTLSMAYASHGAPVNISYTVAQEDTLESIAAKLAAAINAQPSLQSDGIAASAQAALINLYSPSTASTAITWSNSTAAIVTESVTITTSPVLKIATLSVLYRYAILAQALNLSISDLISLKKLTGMNPFTLSSTSPATSNTFQLVQAVQMVASSKFSVAQLNYVYRALPDAADDLPPLQATEDQLAVSLSTGLQTIAAANTFTPDPSGTALQKKLAVLLPADQVSAAMDLINGSSVYASSLPGLPAAATPPSGQVSFMTTLAINGRVSPGDTVTLSVTPSPSVSLSYQVVDTLSSIAASLAAQINTNPALQGVNISASTSGRVITISVPSTLSPSPVWTVASSPSGTATESLVVAPASSGVTVTVGGSGVTTGDTVILSVAISGAAGFPVTLAHAVVEDTLSSIAANLAVQINNNTTLEAAKISATATGTLITIVSPPSAPVYPVWTGASTTSSNTAGAETVVVTNTLQCLGPMTDATKTALLAFSSDPNFVAAVNDIYNQAQDVLSQDLSFLAPATAYVTALASLPAGVTSLTLTSISAGQVNFTSAGLSCYGPMANSTRVALLAISSDTNFTAALNALYGQAWSSPSQKLIDAPPPGQADRYDYVFENLLAYLQTTQSQSLVKQTLSQALSLDSTLVGILVEGDPTTGTAALLPSNAIQSSPNQPAMVDFLGGLLANYYAGTNLTGLLQTQIDPGINLDGTEPAFGSAQWLGRIVPPTTDTYTFDVSFPPGAPAGGKVKLWVDDQLVIDTVDAPNVQVSINLTAGQIYDFQMDFVNATAAPYQFQLQWATSSASQTTIPATAFVLGADPNWAQAVQNSSTFVLGGIYSTLSLLNRITALVNGFFMQTNDVAYLSAHKMDFQGVDPGNSANTAPFDLRTLPLDYFMTPASQTGANPNQSAIDQKAVAFFNQWQRLNNLYSLKASLPSGNTTLFDVFAVAAQSGNANPPVSQAISKAVLQATNWNPTYVNTLLGPSGFSLADLNFKNEIWLVQLAACMAWVNRLGIPALQLLNWSNNAPDSSQAQDIVNTVKAKYSDTTWMTVGKPLNDKIREHSKDALIAYILNMPPIVQLGFADADDLYDYFLIDVQMGTCMLTSRIVQATAAVQQFVQRCLLNLENGNANASLNVSPSAIDATEWENWRQNYRVWQAAVQVFLYPENWIDPTLRDNRTPFFLDLQTQLMQSSITSDNAETAYFSYLEELRQVARLEIMGIYNQTDATAGVNITHVFGRTYSSPHVYFYRNLDNNLNVWSAWQKMDLDIAGDQLIPVVWNNRLYVFWPSYKEITDPTIAPSTNLKLNQTSGNLTGQSSPALKTLYVTMSWSEYRQGAWTKKQTTPDANPLIPGLWTNFNEGNAATTTTYSMNLDTRQFSFCPAQYDGNLTVWMDQNFGVDFAQQQRDFYTSIPLGGFVFTGARTNLAGSPLPPVLQSLPLPPGVQSYGDPSGYYHQYLRTSFPTWEVQWEPVNMAAQYQSFPPALVSPPQGPPPDATFLYLFVVAVAATTTQAPVINPLGVLQTATNNPIPQGYTLMFPAQLGGFVPVTIGSPNFFFQDMQRTFYVTEERQHIIRQFADASYATFPDQPAQIQASEIDFQITAPVFEAKGAVVAKQPVSPSVPANLRPTNSISSTTTTAVFNLSQYLPAEQWQYYFGVTYLPWTLILFANHYHPWIDEFIKLANWQGIPMLLDIRTQQLGLQPDPNDLSNTSSTFDFQSTYGPTGNVINSYPHEIVDTSQAGAYSIYNWELFFHIPFLIGTLLSQNQQFQNAKTWFEYIFNPTNDSPNVPVPNRYWNFLYFNQNTLDGQIGDLLNTLMNPGSPGYQQAYSQVQQWWNNPFDPDSVARLRPVAYEKAVVMAYISNLIAWGDNLFSQNTRESINEATQLYVLADKILGPKPVMVPAQGTVLPVAFKDLQWDALDNALVQLENAFPISITSNPSNSSDSGSSVITSQSRPSTGPVPYFCTPVNSQLLGYWDTVADRLYKIRHCMNIQGQVQQLPLFAPPINPALLVQAAAAGVDLSSVLSDINAAVPYYRFTFMFSKALELCAEVRNLGGQLLSALEKKDAEALSLLRAGQELAVLQAMLQIKQNQINEAQANLQALQDSLAVTQAKQAYYQALVSGGLSTLETAQVNNLTQSQILKQSSQTAGLFGSELSLIPQFDIGASGACSTPVATATFGGQQLSTMASMVAQAFSMQSEFYSFAATMSGLMGGWNRRSAEWQFQLQTAGLEITQINDQINAANIRLQIAQEDLNNQNLQISNAQAVQDFLTNKFTNEDLYSWMVDQVSGVYFQCYQMAYDLAKRAEACFDYELGLSGSNFIQFGYWDSLKQGLLSGEKLYLDLKRMEGAYLDQNKREFEISKSISLVLLDPLALITLKETGQSLVSLPEALFDMDYSGHYMRRIKSLSLTIPCVTGPYTSVNCTLTLLQSKIRSNTQSAAQGNPYLESPIGSDPRFFYNFAATQSIATSTAQNDSGMFEVNFRDERYLPFEGGGVVSQWLISMPTDCNAFDFETITDVIFNLRYTAREGGAPFGAIARSAATLPGPQSQSGISVPTVSFPKKQSNLTRFFSLKHEFPTEWYQFMHPAPMATSETMSIPLTNERFPFQYRGKRITVSQVQMFLQFKAVYPPSVNSSSTPLDDYGSSSLPLTLAPPSVTVTSANGSLATSSGLLGVPFGSIPFSSPAAIYTMAAGQIVPWTLTINSSDIKTVLAGAPNLQLTPAAGGGPFLNPDVIDDLFLVFQYSAQ